MFVCGIIISNIYSSLFYCTGVIINHGSIYPGRCFALSYPTQPASVLGVKVKVVRAPHYANIDGVASMVSYLLSWAI